MRTVAPSYQWPQPAVSKDPLYRWLIGDELFGRARRRTGAGSLGAGSWDALSIALQPPYRVVQRAFAQPGLEGQEPVEGAGEQCISLGWAEIPLKRTSDEAHQHDIRLEVVDADQGTEILPGDPP